jgi:hypothetical protein
VGDDEDPINYPNRPAADYSEGSPYIQSLMAGINEAQGSQKRALEAQMKNASAARENAMKIAQLQASTSRYGIDAQSATAMRALKENARQFDASHGLEIAKAYTAFASTPDLMFARNDFMAGMSRVGQGLNPAGIHSQGTPQAKTWQDFSALAQYNGSQVPGADSGGGGGGGGTSQAASSGGSGLAANGAEQAKAPPDPRIQASTAIMKALPPSESPGADGQDWNAINAIVEMYKSGNPAIGKLTASQQKIGMAGLARAGYDPIRVQEDYLRTRPGQGSPVRAA